MAEPLKSTSETAESQAELGPTETGEDSNAGSQLQEASVPVESREVSNTAEDQNCLAIVDTQESQEGSTPPKNQEEAQSPESPNTETVTSEATPTQIPAEPSPLVVFGDGWSKLDRDVVVDKIKGVIYGQAIGDALGLATEFLTQEQAVKYYGKKEPTKYADIVQDFHRSRWKQGDWTDDTDQLLLILQMIVERKGSVDKCAFAAKMVEWRVSGFKELGDVGGMGIGMTVGRTLSHFNFLKSPHEAAKDIWEQSGQYLAANGAIMRTAILGVLEFNSLERVIANTTEVCLTTHADPRCLASCIAVTTAIALMLQGSYNTNKDKELKALIEAALTHAGKVLEHKDQKTELEEHIRVKDLKKLKLADPKAIGYTFKALGAGFYGLRHSKDFRPTIQQVIMQAGDADSNASVCGALMGCRFGFSKLPQDLLQFPHRQWLDEQVERFLKTIGLQDS